MNDISPRLTRPAAIALTLVAALLLALAPAQLVLRKVIGSEPYPQLMMPSFGDHDARPGAVTSPMLRLVGVRSDGSERELDIPSILPRSQTLPIIIARLQFADRAVISKPESVAWLNKRIRAAYPAERFRALRVIWSEETVLVPSGKHTSRLDDDKSYTVELRSPAGGDR